MTTESLKISWDKVEHADSYEVIFNGGTPSLVKETSMTVGVSDLKDGESYSVSITAKTSDEKKYKDSDPTTTTYQYNAKTTQLAQPSGLNTIVDSGGSWTISWNSVENASYYIITLNGEQVDRIGGTSYTISKDALINNMNYTVGVRAGSDDSKYSESGETQVSTSAVFLSGSIQYNFILCSLQDSYHFFFTFHFPAACTLAHRNLTLRFHDLLLPAPLQNSLPYRILLQNHFLHIRRRTPHPHHNHRNRRIPLPGFHS